MLDVRCWGTFSDSTVDVFDRDPYLTNLLFFFPWAESVPIVGGKGLREWQVLKRKAYLNSWSMMDRLAHLERENALIKKELVMLRKVGSSKLGHRVE